LKGDWSIWRVATSTHFRDSLAEIENNWSLDDLYDAHDVIDLLEELDRRRGESPRK
jgi:hypothetical protein